MPTSHDERYFEVVELLADEVGKRRAYDLAIEFSGYIDDFPASDDAAEWIMTRERVRAA